MSEYPNALLVVEGGQKESALFGRIVEQLHMRFKIVPVCCKIYELYRILERENFDVDIQKAIKELNISDEDRKALEEKSFASIFLVYDCDSKGGNIYPNTPYLTNILTQNKSDIQSEEVNNIMHNKFYIFD